MEKIGEGKSDKKLIKWKSKVTKKEKKRKENLAQFEVILTGQKRKKKEKTVGKTDKKKQEEVTKNGDKTEETE